MAFSCCVLSLGQLCSKDQYFRVFLRWRVRSPINAKTCDCLLSEIGLTCRVNPCRIYAAASISCFQELENLFQDWIVTLQIRCPPGRHVGVSVLLFKNAISRRLARHWLSWWKGGNHVIHLPLAHLHFNPSSFTLMWLGSGFCKCYHNLKYLSNKVGPNTICLYREVESIDQKNSLLTTCCHSHWIKANVLARSYQIYIKKLGIIYRGM